MYILTEGLPGCSGWGCPHKGRHFQVHPHVCAFQATIVILRPIDLYAGVTKCSHAVSDSLVISLVGTISNYFLKLIANQHLTKTLCEPLCPKPPVQNYRVLSKQTWHPARPHPSPSPSFPLAVHAGEVTQWVPLGTGAESALRGKELLMLALPESFLPALGP